MLTIIERSAVIRSIIKVELAAGDRVTFFGLSEIFALPSLTNTSSNLLLLDFLGFPSTVAKDKGIGDSGYVKAAFQSIGRSFFVEKEIKDSMISRFT